MSELTVGDVYRGSFEVVRANLRPYLFFLTLLLVPNLLGAIAIDVIAARYTPPPTQMVSGAELFSGLLSGLMRALPFYLGIGLVLMVTYALAQAGMTFVTVEHMAGRRARVGDAMRIASRALLPLLVASMVIAIVTSIGMIFCFVPGIVAALVLCLTTPVIVVERLGPFVSLNRSTALTEGYRAPIFLVFFALAVAVILGALAMDAVLARALSPEPALMSPSGLVRLVYDAASDGLVTSVITTLIAVIYARIRGLRDGMDVEAFAKVFE
jgi:hypothetical protein